MKKTFAVLTSIMTCGLVFASRTTGKSATGGLALYSIILLVAFIFQFIKFIMNPKKKEHGKELKIALAMLAVFAVLITISLGFDSDTSMVFDIFYLIVLCVPLSIGFAALQTANKDK